MFLDATDIRNIDGSGDEGGDILARLRNARWVFQTKWTSHSTINKEGVEQADAAKAFYRTDRAVLVTNADESSAARKRRAELRSVGSRIDLWNGETLSRFGEEVISDWPPGRIFGDKLRPYQRAAVRKARIALERDGRALVVLATGLGKTVVVGDVIADFLGDNPDVDILVVAHQKELVGQLERALWRHIPKSVPTQVLTGDRKPPDLMGVTCATVTSALRVVREDGYRPALVVVDEAHHVSASGTYADLLGELADVPQLGVTATPWRGDRYDLSRHFGDPVFRMGIADGMTAGYLADVDYRLLIDENVDWEAVHDASALGLSVRDLNHKLFLPQRDEEIADHIRVAWNNTPQPRAIVFCRTINHAEEFAQLLRERGWTRAEVLSNRQSKRERNILMSEFADGRVPIVCAVDVLNEGVDVPDVNILCFVRHEHRRRKICRSLYSSRVSELCGCGSELVGGVCDFSVVEGARGNR